MPNWSNEEIQTIKQDVIKTNWCSRRSKNVIEELVDFKGELYYHYMRIVEMCEFEFGSYFRLSGLDTDSYMLFGQDDNLTHLSLRYIKPISYLKNYEKTDNGARIMAWSPFLKWRAASSTLYAQNDDITVRWLEDALFKSFKMINIAMFSLPWDIPNFCHWKESDIP